MSALPDWMVAITPEDWLTGSVVGRIVGNDLNSQDATVTWHTETNEVRSAGSVYHGSGYRRVEAWCPLDALLDSIAATKAGRRAMLEALTRQVAS